MFAKGQVAIRIAVLDQMRPVLARDSALTLPDSHFVHPRIREPGATGEQGFLARFQQTADQ